MTIHGESAMAGRHPGRLAILGTLDVVHRGQAMHRDLTPFNVFVCKGEALKLGDFGIATHQASSRGTRKVGIASVGN